jgi:biopolymer transport protein ExbD
MTKHLFVIVAGIGVFSACAHKAKGPQVPASTKAAFEKQYPGVNGEWDKEDSNYEVEFKQDGKEMSMVIDKNGKVVETETDIPVADLPQAIRDYMKQNYSGSKIDEATKIIKSDGEINYEAEVSHKDVLFDANGKFIKESTD